MNSSDEVTQSIRPVRRWSGTYRGFPSNLQLRSSKLFAVLSLIVLASCQSNPNATTKLRTTFIEWKGWPGSYRIENGRVEVVIIPTIGRVMSFGFIGEESPIWDNPNLYGRAPDPFSNEWGNFGGDKTWPAPQSKFEQVSGRSWPPPATFDSTPLEAKISGDEVILVSRVDPKYGVRTHRRILLPPNSSSLQIVTTYEKLEGAPVEIGVWVVSQLTAPIVAFIPVPKNSQYKEGYNPQGPVSPEHISVRDGWIRVSRDPKVSQKIGSDAGSMLWVGAQHALRIDCPRIPNEHYPDNESSVELYTNGGPLPYVELETLSPLRTLAVGQSLSATNTYTIYHRKHSNPEVEASEIYRNAR